MKDDELRETLKYVCNESLVIKNIKEELNKLKRVVNEIHRTLVDIEDKL